MGKKKKARRAAEQAAHGARGEGFAVPPQVAGIAAMVLGQVNSPAGRKIVADVLHKAADALDGRSGRAVPAAPPAPPVPPVPPMPPVPPEPPRAYAPKFEGAPINLPPEASRVIEAAASALERWAERLAKPPRPPEP